jgi:hypothetical protein
MRDHLDHHMPILLDADGPFNGCKPDQHAHRLEAFPLKPPVPANLFGVQTSCWQSRSTGRREGA